MSRPAILDLLQAQVPGAVVFEKGEDNLNIIFERRLPGRVNYYDDLVHLVGRDASGAWYDHVSPCTTDPGLPSLVPGRPTRPSGTWCTQPGQYLRSHEIGLHHGEPALVQRFAKDATPLRGWRDRNDNGIVDRTGPTYTDGGGINHHHGGDSELVGAWSEGCLVVPRRVSGRLVWALHWEIILRASKRWGPVFSISLIEVPE
jgi:hypothetical protein